MLEGPDSGMSKIDDAWLVLVEGVYSTGSGSLISPESEVFKRGRGGDLIMELSLLAVW